MNIANHITSNTITLNVNIFENKKDKITRYVYGTPIETITGFAIRDIIPIRYCSVVHSKNVKHEGELTSTHDKSSLANSMFPFVSLL
jgi:hypothetical protein